MKLVLTAWAATPALQTSKVATFVMACRAEGYFAKYLAEGGKAVGLIVVADHKDRLSFEERLKRLGFKFTEYGRVEIYESYDETRVG